MTAYTLNLTDAAPISDVSLNNVIVEDEMNLILSALNIAGISANKVYDLKTVDVQRVGIFAVTWRDSETVEYVGYGGRQRYVTYSDSVRIYGSMRNFEFQQKVLKYRQAILSYNQSLMYNFVAGKFIWINVKHETNEIDEERGIQMYLSKIEVRLYQQNS